jgi:hypothetical protein
MISFKQRDVIDTARNALLNQHLTAIAVRA